MVGAEELAPAELGVGGRWRLETWPFTPARFGLSTGTKEVLYSQPRNSEDVVGWLRLAGEKQAETDQVCSRVPDLVTEKSERMLFGRVWGTQQGQAPSPISLMDGSCAANAVRAGNGLGSCVCRDWPIPGLL